jgi:hypothetical protein
MPKLSICHETNTQEKELPISKPPFKREEFTFRQEELQRKISTSSDPRNFPWSGKEPRLSQQNELSDLVREFKLSKRQAEVLGSRPLQWKLMSK